MSKIVMTDKQKKILSKYLNADNMQKLIDMNSYDVNKNFINLIFNTRYYSSTGEHTYLKLFTDNKLSEKRKKMVEALINKNRKELGLVEDEYARVIGKEYLDKGHCWYLVKQSWLKGMSNTATTRTARIKLVDYKCMPFEGIYNALFDIGIYSMEGLINFYWKEGTKEHQKEKVDNKKSYNKALDDFVEMILPELIGYVYPGDGEKIANLISETANKLRINEED